VIASQLADKLKRGIPAMGVITVFDDPSLLEVAGPVGDFTWLDMQHGAVRMDRLPSLIRTCELLGTAALVRPPGHSRQEISVVLDWDAAGVIVPQVDTAEQAAELVRAAKFPPLGDRSYGGHRVIARQGADYAERVNAEQLLIVQLESPTAVGNADTLASTPGVDCLMLAPADLRLRLGVPQTASLACEEVMDAARQVVAACRRHDKLAMGLVFEPDDVRRFIAAGFNLMVAATLSRFVQQGAEAARRMFDAL